MKKALLIMLSCIALNAQANKFMKAKDPSHARPKEGGNALLLPNGETVYRQHLCESTDTLPEYLAKDPGLKANFMRLQKTMDRFHPAIGQRIGLPMVVCITSRPIGPILGLGDSKLRVAGYIPGDSKAMILLSKGYLNTSPKTRVVAEILFAESLQLFSSDHLCENQPKF